jgi:putative oxidoreductase
MTAMFYADHTTLEIIGQLMIATLFLGTLILNAGTKEKQHVDRMAAMNIPLPRATLWAGFALQAVGGLMVAIDWHAGIGAVLLIVFTVLASAIFHRFWTVDDPLRRHLHLSFVFSNIAVIGALLLLV